MRTTTGRLGAKTAPATMTMVATAAWLWLVPGCGDDEAGDGDAGAATSEGESTTGAGSSTSAANVTTGSAGSGDGTTSAGSESGSAEETGDPANLEPWPSVGCGASTLAPGEHNALTLEHDGIERSYNLYLPEAHDGETPIPLVFNFHGFTSAPVEQAFFSGFNPVAEASGVAVVYPAGLENSWNAGSCCGDAMADGADDVGYARSLAAALSETLCIDERRIYSTGMSNGGFLSYRLACEVSDLFAAIAPVAGVLGVPVESCNPERPVPVMHFHGTQDNLVLYQGGGATGSPGVVETVSGWAERNECGSEPTVTFQEDPVTCETWSGCGDGGEVVLCTAEGVGHCWPGQDFCPFGSSTTAINASETMVEFFADHPMP